MELPISVPPWTTNFIAVTVVQLLLTCSQYFLESREGKQTPYSKFFDNKKSFTLLVSGRIGMLVIYVPAMLFSLYALHSASVASPFSFVATLASPLEPRREVLVACLLFLHFLKRNLEVLFLHKYSKAMDIMTGAPIGLYYTLVCWIITHFQQFVPDDYNTTDSLTCGLAFFIVGQLGNFYHHYLLATLRPYTPAPKKSDRTSYSVPSGGLFSLVTMPHYTFELLSWFGVAVVARSLNSLLVVTSMMSYLGGRAVATRNWYMKNVKGFPKERKVIIPFFF
jgi:hypothetical protein